MKLIYVSEVYSESIIYTQVFDLLNYYLQTNKFEEIIFMAGIKFNDNTRQAIRERLNKGISVRYYKHYPDYPFLANFIHCSMNKEFKKIKNLSEYVIHVRSLRESHHVFNAFRKIGIGTKNILADVRGATYEETKEFSKRNKFLVKQKLNLISKSLKTLSRINNISCVSNSLKKYLENKIGDSSNNIHINSCLATRDFIFSRTFREEIRKEHGIKENEILLVLSSGGNGVWQNTENTINKLYSNYRVLNLSRSIISHPNVVNKFVSYKDVPKYLCAADIAIIWREPSVVNKVASPVKFSEYVCCGLPIVTNESIDLIKDYTIDNNCGIVLQSLDDLTPEMMQPLIKLDRELLSNIGRKVFGIEVIAYQYMEIYQKRILKNDN